MPQLIILDVELPKMDGYHVAQHLKAAPWFSQTVLIMLSGRDGVMDRLKGRLAGAKEYHTKPMTTQWLVSLVRKYLGTPSPEQQESYDLQGGTVWKD